MLNFDNFIEKMYNYGIDDFYSVLLKYDTSLASDFDSEFISYDQFGDKKPKRQWNTDNFTKFVNYNHSYLKVVHIKYILCELVDNNPLDNIYDNIKLFEKFIKM